MDPFPYMIRRIDPEKDAAQIAELVKKSFRPWLDRENIDYLNELRKTGEEALAHPIRAKILGFPYSMPGVACIDDTNTVLGVINTYYFYQNSQKCCLVVNVCTDRNHRKEGIASQMLREVEQTERKNGVFGLYLQARMEVPETIVFYKNNGFSATDIRDTWIRPIMKDPHPYEQTGLHTEIVPVTDKKIFEDLFRKRYPPSVIWNQDYNRLLFRTGRIADILYRLDLSRNRFRRVARKSGEIKAWAAFQQMQASTDQLWFVPNENLSSEDQSRALQTIMNEYKGKKALKLDTPAGEDSQIFKSAGFTHQHTLAWMWKRL